MKLITLIKELEIHHDTASKAHLIATWTFLMSSSELLRQVISRAPGELPNISNETFQVIQSFRSSLHRSKKCQRRQNLREQWAKTQTNKFALILKKVSKTWSGTLHPLSMQHKSIGVLWIRSARSSSSDSRLTIWSFLLLVRTIANYKHLVWAAVWSQEEKVKISRLPHNLAHQIPQSKSPRH